MNNFSIRRCRVIAAWVLLFIGMSANANEYPDLNMQGRNYPNSCAPEQRQILQKEIIKGDVQDATQVWKAVELILCVPEDDASRKQLISLFYKKVRKAIDSTGEAPIFKTMFVSEELASKVMAGGNAWNASILVEKSKIVLQYFVNEACVKSATLFYKKSKWSVYEIGQACD
jgi:hypothetical protein